MPEIIPIGGGKGGVGKSFVAASLGALIAKRGSKVLLIDLNLGGSNLHTLLGIKSPARGLNDFLNKRVGVLDDVAVATTIPNLLLISSCHCSVEIANIHYAQKVKLINAMRNLDLDYVLIDLGAGTNFNTLDFFLTASKGLVICTPEPTSVENSFRFIKAVYLRRLKQIIKQHGFAPVVKNAVAHQGSVSYSAGDLIEQVRTHDPDRFAELKMRIGRFEFKFLLNQLRKQTDVTLGSKIQTACNRHFYSPFDFLGNVHFDERVHDAVYRKELFVNGFPGTATALELQSIADRLTQPSLAAAAQ